jgi:hypothetical protein
MAIIIENREAGSGLPRTHRNEFPAEYSLAGCSPALPALRFLCRSHSASIHLVRESTFIEPHRRIYSPVSGRGAAQSFRIQ